MSEQPEVQICTTEDDSRTTEAERQWLEDYTAALVRQGYTLERANELAVWALHVHTGGD